MKIFDNFQNIVLSITDIITGTDNYIYLKFHFTILNMLWHNSAQLPCGNNTRKTPHKHSKTTAEP